MKFSVGDKVVHPHHGPGWIAGIERRDLLAGAKRYYVIEIPEQRLTLRVPVRKADKIGMRLAMSESRFPRVLGMLGSSPHLLPNDYRERQAQIWAQLETGRVMQLARVVRDLTWHRKLAHLTKTDTEYLKQGRNLLAAEMALVSGAALSDASKLIESTVIAAIANTPKYAES
jgi:CarD family transcriptional regulator